MANPMDRDVPTTEDLLDGQLTGELVEVDEEGRIMPHAPPGRPGGGKSVVLHDPHGEYASPIILSPDLVVTAPEAQRPRWRVEQEKLARRFPGFRLLGTRGVVSGCAGEIRSNGDRGYPIRIDVPANYPYDMPTVLATGWRPADGCPHTWGGDRLCLMRVEQWSSSYTLAFVAAKASIWIAKYESWLGTRRWPGSDAHGPTPRPAVTVRQWAAAVRRALGGGR